MKDLRFTLRTVDVLERRGGLDTLGMCHADCSMQVDQILKSPLSGSNIPEFITPSGAGAAWFSHGVHSRPQKTVGTQKKGEESKKKRRLEIETET